MDWFSHTPYTFETITRIIGVVILIALIISLAWWHVRFKHPEKDRFLKWWRHPFTRIATSILSFFLNIYSIIEDPTIQSWRNMDLGLLSLSIRFMLADWPHNYLICMLKVVMVGCAVVASLTIGIYLIHHRLLRGYLDLEMFEKSRGQTVVAAVFFLPLIAVWAAAYNLFIYVLRCNSSNWTDLPYVESIIPISYHTLGMITSSITGCGCSISLIMIIDTMLQDPTRYASWCRRLRSFWTIHRQRISWVLQGGFSGIWLAFVWTGGISVYRQSAVFTFMRTTETTRCFVLGLCTTLDICSITQDWEFPSFDNPLELKLVFLNVSRLILCPKRNRQKTTNNAVTRKKVHFPGNSSPYLLPRQNAETQTDMPSLRGQSVNAIVVTQPLDNEVHEESVSQLISTVNLKEPPSGSAKLALCQPTGLAVTDSSDSVWRRASEDLLAFVGLEDVVVSGKWFNYGAMIIDLYLNLSNIAQAILYRPVDYAQYVQPNSRVLWSIVDSSLANAPINTLKASATWNNRAAFRDQDVPLSDIELHARFTGGPPLIAAVISIAPVFLGLAVFFESLRKYNRHPDDVARRAALRAQHAVKRLRGALKFISLAKSKTVRAEDNKDAILMETSALLPEELYDGFPLLDGDVVSPKMFRSQSDVANVYREDDFEAKDKQPMMYRGSLSLHSG